jgi:chromosome segregation ATPase
LITPEDLDTKSKPEEAGLKVERNGLRVALAAARGTILDLRSHLADLGAAQEFLRVSREAAVAETRELRERFSAAQEEVRVREEALLAERDWLLSVRDAQATRLGELEPLVRQIAALTEGRNALARRLELLDRLIRDLRWENGPRSVRVLLPLARLIRRLGGG